jgi:hypothetical protein
MKKILFVHLYFFIILIFSYFVYAADSIIQETEKGKYIVEMVIKDKELKLGNNSIDILIRDSDGKGVEGLAITIQPWMPDMGHGIDIQPIIYEKGSGKYTLDNVYISMSGHWELRIDIARQGIKDHAVFDFANIGDVEGETMTHAHAHHMVGQAPIGVMGGHTHQQGKWMVAYQYMYMDMDGNRDGTDREDSADVLKDFMVSPLNMTMQMHMLGIMYAPTNKLTLMAMFPYIHKEMNHRTRMGAEFTTRTEGIGDIKASALYTFYQESTHWFYLNAGLSFPTGSIDEMGHTPMGRNVQLPYPMQLGSGTFDLLPGVTYLGNSGKWSWGSQVLATVRLGENDNDYALGDEFGLNGWVARAWTDWLGTSVRIEGKYWGDIEGADPDIAAVNMMGVKIVPTADPGLRSGRRIDLLLGIDLAGKDEALKNGRLAVEGGFPIYQYLDGPQLETDWLLTAGLQWMF